VCSDSTAIAVTIGISVSITLAIGSLWGSVAVGDSCWVVSNSSVTVMGVCLSCSPNTSQ